MVDDLRPPFRQQFDNARDPYTARNALGITTFGGNVSNSGTPTAGQYAKWVTATTIQGVATATVLTDIGAQPLDADLTAIAALAGTNTIYYRSAANTWSAVNVSTGLAFSGGNLTATAVTVAMQKFTSSGTYTPTAGMVYAIIECVGGGGGGGAAYKATGYAIAGGGGSGAYSRKLVTAANIGASKTVTIGAAGPGGTGLTSPTAGTAGGDTSVGNLCVAKGGLGGLAGLAGAGFAGGLGGSGAAGTGDITASGAPGGGGFTSDGSSACYAGHGGSSIFGGGATVSSAHSSGAPGVNATLYGSGGSGASTFAAIAANGGAGSAGVVIITEYK